MVARNVRNVEVRGSNPLCSTKHKRIADGYPFVFLVKSRGVLKGTARQGKKASGGWLFSSPGWRRDCPSLAGNPLCSTTYKAPESLIIQAHLFAKVPTNVPTYFMSFENTASTVRAVCSAAPSISWPYILLVSMFWVWPTICFRALSGTPSCRQLTLVCLSNETRFSICSTLFL